MQNPKPQLFTVENSLGSLEAEVMRVIWNEDKATVRDVLNTLKNEKSIAYTTVMTVMDHLYQKGFLEREKIEKSYYYFPITKENEVVKASLTRVIADLNSGYGKGRVLYYALKSGIFPQIHLNISTYRLSVGYGIALTFLLTLLGLSAFDLAQNLSFFGAWDYLNLLASDSNLLVDKLYLFIYAFAESLPVINIFTTIISLVLVILLLRKLSKFLDFKITLFNLGGGAIS